MEQNSNLKTIYQHLSNLSFFNMHSKVIQHMGVDKCRHVGRQKQQKTERDERGRQKQQKTERDGRGRE